MGSIQRMMVFLAALGLLCALGPGLARAQTDAPEGVLLYNNLDCFNINETGPRYCAEWRLRGLEEGKISWQVMVYAIHRSTEVFNSHKILTQEDVKQWLKALNTGLKWSHTARQKRVDVTKTIATLPGGIEAAFVSGSEGGYCAVRIHNPAWTEKAPLYMYVPYMENTRQKGSISDMIAALKSASKQVRLFVKHKREQQALFK